MNQKQIQICDLATENNDIFKISDDFLKHYEENNNIKIIIKLQKIIREKNFQIFKKSAHCSILENKTYYFKNAIIEKEDEFNFYKYKYIKNTFNSIDILENEFGFMRFTNKQYKKLNKYIKEGFNKCLFVPDKDKNGEPVDDQDLLEIEHLIYGLRRESQDLRTLKNIKSGFKYENEKYNKDDKTNKEPEYIKMLENTNIYLFKNYEKNLKDLYLNINHLFNQEQILIMEFKKPLEENNFKYDKNLLFILQYQEEENNNINKYFKNIFLDKDDIRKNIYSNYILKNKIYNKFNYIKNNLNKYLVIDRLFNNIDVERYLKDFILYDHIEEHKKKFNMCLYEMYFLKGEANNGGYTILNRPILKYLIDGKNKMLKCGLLKVYTPFNCNYFIQYDSGITFYYHSCILRCLVFNDFTNARYRVKKYSQLKFINKIRTKYFKLPEIKTH